MTIAFDAVSSATPGNDDLSWTHTPVGTPAGVLVYIVQNVGPTGEINSVVYGGVPMSIGLNPPALKATGEAGAVYLYYLDTGVPAGAQTVTVDTLGPVSVKAAVCITVTGTPPLILEDASDGINFDSVSNPITLLNLDGYPGFVSLAFLSGADDVASVSPQVGWTSRYEYDFGGAVGGVYTYDTVEALDVYAGWLQDSDDALAIAAVLRELGPSASPSVSPSASRSPSASPSASPSVSLSPSKSPSKSPSISPSESPSVSMSPSVSPSWSPTASVSPSISPSRSPTASRSPSTSPSVSISPSASPSVSLSPSKSPSQSPSVSRSPSKSPSQSPSASVSPSVSRSPSLSPSVSPSPSPGAREGPDQLGLWVDVETGAGVKLGSGPITSAGYWRQVRRLDRAGTFEFEMPASDETKALITAKRVVRCYGIVGGQVAEIGAGIVDRVEYRVGDPTMVRVSGDDLLRELTYRSVGTLDWWVPGDVLPENVHKVYDDPGRTGEEAYYALDAAYDGDAGTSASFTGMGGFDWLYIMYSHPFSRVDINFGATLPGALAAGIPQYFDGQAWVNVTGLTDTTRIGGDSWKQDGYYTYNLPSDWAACAQTAPGGVTLTGYWLRVSNTVNPTDLAEITVRGRLPTSTALADTMALAPAGWSIDATGEGHAATKNTVYSTCSDESVLGALVKLAELTGEHFRLGAGRSVTWLQDDPSAAPVSCGLRAIRADADPISLEGNSDVALITELRTVSESYELASRVIPYGAGIGEARLTLAQTTRSAGAGYTLSTAGNYLIHDSAEATYGRIERVQTWGDIGPTTTAAAERIRASDALFDAAKVWLSRHAAPQVAYELSVVKADSAILPGQTIRVIWDEWVDGYHSVAVDATLIVLEAATEIDERGVRTVGLTVSTVDAWPQSETELLAGQVKQVSQLARFPQALDSTTLRSGSTPAGWTALASGSGGMIWQRMTGTTSIRALSDTSVFQPGAGEVLAYDAPSGLWKNQTLGFVGLTTPLTSTAWDSDAKVAGDTGTLDLSAVFGVPAGVKAVLLALAVRDETVGVVAAVGPAVGSYYPLVVRTQVAGQVIDNAAVVPCDQNGDIYLYLSDEVDAAYLTVWGYWQ